MKELDQILQLWAQTERANETAVLATVVKTQGSSYRLPGARLLLARSGQRAGSISGGCLEDDLVKKAFWFTENGPIVRRYDTTPDGEIGSGGFGLGCNGIIHVLLERLEPGRARPLDLIRQVRAQRRPAAIAHVIAPGSIVGQSVIVDIWGATHSTISNAEISAALTEEVHAALAAATSRHLRIDASTEAFIETVTPATRLLVFGAGDDAVPLTQLAKYLGWQVSVFDGRAHYARRDKFPHADEVSVRSPGLAANLAIDRWTVAVLMSHSYSQDLEVLRELSSRALPYLGILGPRKRAVQLLADADLNIENIAPELHSPMGLDIGADGPEQVALSVLAEIQAVLNGREGGLLCHRRGSIHAPEAESGQPWVQPIACA